jgi:hypothetical protein
MRVSLEDRDLMLLAGAVRSKVHQLKPEKYRMAVLRAVLRAEAAVNEVTKRKQAGGEMGDLGTWGH